VTFEAYFSSVVALCVQLTRDLLAIAVATLLFEITFKVSILITLIKLRIFHIDLSFTPPPSGESDAL